VKHPVTPDGHYFVVRTSSGGWQFLISTRFYKMRYNGGPLRYWPVSNDLCCATSR